MSTIEKALAKQKSNQPLAEPAESQVEPAVSNSSPAEAEQTATPSVAEPSASRSSSAKPAVATSSPPSADIVIDGEDLISRGYMFDATSRKVTQDEFRHIKRKLLNNAFGGAAKTLNNSNLIMVSSSNPNEGKTFVSINLALSIALEQDKTVLLIDADVLRPSINNELKFEQKTGLMEYLLNEVDDLGNIIYSTNIHNLKIIPAGKPHHLSNELLASNKMVQLAQELASRYPDRIVIFDCPPILGITETPVLSHLMGQAVIVVEESKTKIDDVKMATSLLNEELAMGLVMNKALKSSKDKYGYYGYGYGA